MEKRKKLKGEKTFGRGSLLIPEAWLPEEELIPKEQLEKIRKQVADDWKKMP